MYSLLSISHICTRIFLFWTLEIGVHNWSVVGQVRAGRKTAGLGSSVLSHDDLTREVILYVRNGCTLDRPVWQALALVQWEFCNFLPYGQEGPAFRPNILACPLSLCWVIPWQSMALQTRGWSLRFRVTPSSHIHRFIFIVILLTQLEVLFAILAQILDIESKESSKQDDVFWSTND